MSKLVVFLASSLALVVAAGMGVVAGGLLSTFISEKALSLIAGVGFVAIGLYILYQATGT